MKMLTVAQAANQLGISDALVYALVRTSAVEAYKFSSSDKRGTIRIEQTALDTYKTSRRVTPCPLPSTAPASAGTINLKAASVGTSSALASYFQRAAKASIVVGRHRLEL